MNSKVLLAVGALLAGAAGIYLWQSGEPVDETGDENPTMAATKRPAGQSGTTLANKIAAPAPQQDDTAWYDQQADLPAPEETAWEPSPSAVASLREATLNGDPRTPPLAKAPEREMPTEEELGDPDLYLQYEMRQQQAVYASFLEAANRQLEEMDALIARAEAEGGVTEAQLEEGRRKRDMLLQQRDALLAEHPDLATGQDTDETAP